MPLSKDPEKREAQLRNLRPVGGKVTHGATSESKLKPLRDKHLAELLERFPRLDGCSGRGMDPPPIKRAVPGAASLGWR